MNQATAEKEALRQAARERRAAAHGRQAGCEGDAIAANFLQSVPWQRFRVIAGYCPMGDEADCGPLLGALARQGANLALPAVIGRGKPLEFRRWQLGSTLEPGPFGTRHPMAGSPLERPDLVLVPLLAYDAFGHRLGYGGGYYDRALAELRGSAPILAVGIAFAAQIHGQLPAEPHDQRLDWLVTEESAREFFG